MDLGTALASQHDECCEEAATAVEAAAVSDKVSATDQGETREKAEAAEQRGATREGDEPGPEPATAAAEAESVAASAATGDRTEKADGASAAAATNAGDADNIVFQFPAQCLVSGDKDSGNPSSDSGGHSDDEQPRINPFSARSGSAEETGRDSREVSAEAGVTSDSSETPDKEEPSKWVVPQDPLSYYGRKDIVLMAIRGAPGNRRCADCRRSDPDWADLKYGVLTCIQCCGAHRALTRHVPLIKNLSVDSQWQWTQEQYRLLLRGNSSANAHLEKHRPAVYPVPQPMDTTVLRLQYVLAKYDNQEFTDNPVKEPSYRQSQMCARFLKRHRHRDDWAPRDFFLSIPEAKIIYGVPANEYGSPCRPTAKLTKGAIPLLRTRVELVNAEVLDHESNESILMLVFADDDEERDLASPKSPSLKKALGVGAKARKMRTIFLKRSGLMVQPLVEWMVAIRRVQISAQSAAPPPVIRMGWMMKKGEDPSSGYKKRWFVLDRTALRYYVSCMESTSQGTIPLGPSRDGYKVWSSVADSPDCNEFTIRTASSRDFWLSAYTSTDFLIWLKHIKEIVDGTPASPTLPK